MYTCPGEEPAVDYFVGPAQSKWFDPETIHLITQKSNFFLYLRESNILLSALLPDGSSAAC